MLKRILEQNQPVGGVQTAVSKAKHLTEVFTPSRSGQ